MAKPASFEKFRRAAATAAGQPLVAIHSRGIFAMNQMAYEALGEPDACELFYDRENRIIGLRGAPRRAPDAYTVRHHTRYSHQIAGKSFLSFYEIPEEATGRRYGAELVDGILTVDLKQDAEETGKNRAEKDSAR